MISWITSLLFQIGSTCTPLHLGGLFRESWREAAEDLAGGAGGLFVPSPGGVGGDQPLQETFVPNPGAAAPALLRMLMFVGQLMGAALRWGCRR